MRIFEVDFNRPYCGNTCIGTNDYNGACALARLLVGQKLAMFEKSAEPNLLVSKSANNWYCHKEHWLDSSREKVFFHRSHYYVEKVGTERVTLLDAIVYFAGFVFNVEVVENDAALRRDEIKYAMQQIEIEKKIQGAFCKYSKTQDESEFQEFLKKMLAS